MLHRSLATAVAVVVTLATARPALAQSKIEFTPWAGMYMPSHAIVADTAGSVSIFEVTNGGVFGGRLSYWFADRFAVEANVGLAASRIHLVGGTSDFEFRASTAMADVRGRVEVTTPGKAIGLHLMAGAGITRARNSYFDIAGEILPGFEYKTSIGPVVGMGATRRLSQGTVLRIDLEDRIYSTNVDTGASTTQDRTQHDFLFTIGLGLQL
ncbi:MAG: outer membrane beta-barrel protein [Gemmatimonadota bacterium]